MRRRQQQYLPSGKISFYLKEIKVSTTDELGIPVQWVEAIAFAWLAKKEGLRGNMEISPASQEPRPK